MAQINRSFALKPANAAGTIAPPESLSVGAGYTIEVHIATVQYWKSCPLPTFGDFAKRQFAAAENLQGARPAAYAQ